jgi:succinate-acetate transporter protein
MKERHHPIERLEDPAPLALAAFALPLFIWSAFNADYFGLDKENFVIPLAVFFGGPLAIGAAMWAYHRRDAYLATVAGVFGAYWITYGMLLWLTHQGVIDGPSAGGDLRGLLFAAWAVTFGLLWLASIREHWALGLVTLGAGLMFVLLSIGYYSDSHNALRAGGWIGFITAGVAWYGALAQLLNAEYDHAVLPTGLDEIRKLLHFGAR